MLVNDVTLRGLTASELAKGFGFFQSKPSSAFSPVAVTPDELGDRWDGGKLIAAAAVLPQWRAARQAKRRHRHDLRFRTLIAHAARTRSLGAGSIVGSGTVSNKAADGGPGKPIKDGGVGYSCLAEQRVVETILEGKPRTPFLKSGDMVRIEMLDDKRHSIFGAIEQTVV